VGLDTLIDAGYDPNAFADFFAVLGAEEGEEDFLSFLSTHPAAGERAEELKKRIAAMDSVPSFQGDAAAWDAFLGSL
jgi:predicted Zn-dependent protease